MPVGDGRPDAGRRVRVAEALVEAALAALGTAILALYVPWQHVFSSTIPTGGDNPAHPVLMRSVGEAFFSHLAVVHYSYRFWSGFEVFQFYFPLPYVCGAALARVIHPNVAFKLTTLAGLLGLPVGFYYMAKGFGLSKITCVIASLLSLSFLFTDAHVMWGGNVNSALAGMIANSWAFVFVTLAFGSVLRAWREGRFLVAGVVFTVLAMLSHFYATLMLFLLFGTLFLQDAWPPAGWLARFRRRCPAYAMGVVAVMLTAWWIVPLVVYQPWSAEYGGNWDVDFLATFRRVEKIATVVSLLLVVGYLLRRPTERAGHLTGLLFAGVAVGLYFFGYLLPSPAFMNIRIWPTVYLALYILILLAVEAVWRVAPLPLFAGAIALLWMVIPSEDSTNKAAQWMTWNFSGIEAKEGGAEYMALMDRLKAEPPGRVSFEADGRNNHLLGSVRAFELIPYLTHHEIVEGGIVNSAKFAGIGYFLQCFTSSECAGWPNGTIVPDQDIPRAIEMMQALGVDYHIAARDEARRAFDASGQVVALHGGQRWTLYKLRAPAGLVEVYDGPPLTLRDRKPLTTLANLPRWDVLRRQAVVFDDGEGAATPEEAATNRRFFDFLVREWSTERRVVDRGWPDRKGDRAKFLNAYVLSRRDDIDLRRDLGDDPEFFIADRNWDPDVYAPSLLPAYPALAVILRREDGDAPPLDVHGRGYRALARGAELALNAPVTMPDPAPDEVQTVITFHDIRTEAYPYLDVWTNDSVYHLGQVDEGPITAPVLPERITERCDVSLERAFHKLTLRTACPGKPHLIKYSYYPKWRADVPIRLGSNGFMVVEPVARETVLEHRNGFPDRVGMGISVLGLVGLLLGRRFLG